LSLVQVQKVHCVAKHKCHLNLRHFSSKFSTTIALFDKLLFIVTIIVIQQIFIATEQYTIAEFFVDKAKFPLKTIAGLYLPGWS